MCLSRLISHEPSKSSEVVIVKKSRHLKAKKQAEIADFSKHGEELFEQDLATSLNNNRKLPR